MKTFAWVQFLLAAGLGGAVAQTMPAFGEDPADIVNDYVSIGEWKTAGNPDNWSRSSGAIAPFVIANGLLEVTTIGGDPNLSRGSFATVLSTTPELTIVEVGIRLLEGSGTGWEMYWGTTEPGQGGISGARRINYDLSIVPDDKFHILQFDFTGVFPAGVSLRDFRIDPGPGAGNKFQLDYVRVGRVMPDGDADGLPDVAETGSGVFTNRRNAGTNPAKADTDGDGIPDGLEVNLGANPNDRAAYPVPTIDRYDVNPAVYIDNVEIKPNYPTVTTLPTDGPVKSFAIQPALPAGLVFAATSGIISGTPTVLSPKTNYTVTVTFQNNATATAVLSLEVRSPYITFGALVVKRTLKVNQDLGAGIVPYSYGATASTTYSIAPPLPAGLSLDTSTGTVSGAATEYSPLTTYTVTAKFVGFADSKVSFQMSVLEDPAFVVDPDELVVTYISWGEFDKLADANGWFRNGIAAFTEIVDGALVVKNIGPDPFFGRDGTLAVDYRILEIRAKIVEGTETGFRTYWSENGVGRGYSETTAFSFNAVADEEYHVYQVDYRKAIERSFNGLRLDPGNGAGNVMHVDYWRLGSFNPRLKFARQANGSFRLSWPAVATGWVLQSTVTLPGGWVPAGGTTATEDKESVAVVQLAGAAKYYRLIKQ